MSSFQMKGVEEAEIGATREALLWNLNIIMSSNLDWQSKNPMLVVMGLALIFEQTMKIVVCLQWKKLRSIKMN